MDTTVSFTGEWRESVGNLLSRRDQRVITFGGGR
jgi:hypothetical protein